VRLFVLSTLIKSLLQYDVRRLVIRRLGRRGLETKPLSILAYGCCDSCTSHQVHCISALSLSLSLMSPPHRLARQFQQQTSDQLCETLYCQRSTVSDFDKQRFRITRRTNHICDALQCACTETVNIIIYSS